MTEVDIHDYPPYKMTDAQAAATVGRFQEHQEPTPAPNIAIGEHEHEMAAGRTPAAPPGVVYTGDVYATDKGESVSAHDASVAAYPEKVRSSVPDAVEVTEGADEPEEPEPESAPVEDSAEDDDALAETQRAAAEAQAEAEAQAQAEAAAEADRVEAERAAEAQRAADAAQAEAEREAASAREREAAAEAERAAQVDWNERTVAELRVELSNRGIDYDYSARKADLVALLEAHATAA